MCSKTADLLLISKTPSTSALLVAEWDAQGHEPPLYLITPLNCANDENCFFPYPQIKSGLGALP
jgi:hypothetical protein